MNSVHDILTTTEYEFQSHKDSRTEDAIWRLLTELASVAYELRPRKKN